MSQFESCEELPLLDGRGGAKRILDGSGHRILAATSGKSALQIAERVKPDLILLDVMMPDIDGFEVCRRLKANPITENVAVIFLSALGEVGDKVTGLELGAADYITKPIQSEEVLARVASQLLRLQLEREVRQSRDSLDQELGAAAAMQRLILPALQISIACAGHPAPLVLRNGTGTRINCDFTLPLLLMNILDIPTSEHKLHPGDRLLFYTDGITERQSPAGDMFEVEGIEAAVRNSHDLQSEQLMNSIVAGMESFAAGSEPHDDQRLLLITVG